MPHQEGEQTYSTAPAFDLESVELSPVRRAFQNGLGYILPNTVFLAMPFVFGFEVVEKKLAAFFLVCIAIAILLNGTAFIVHWRDRYRWIWFITLGISLVVLGWLTDFRAKPAYYMSYITCPAALLFAWRQAKLIIIAVAFVFGSWMVIDNDRYGIIVVFSSFFLSFWVGASIESNRTKERLWKAEERTAILAVAAERERIGRDLHDILGHSLTTIAVKADLAERLIKRSDASAVREVAELAKIARQALADVRSTASGIRKVRLASEVVSVRSVLVSAGIKAIIPSAMPLLEDEISELFGYVVREAVTNVVRHSKASRCEIVTTEDSVSIHDNGQGFDEGRKRSGLEGLRQRVEDAGGELIISSNAEGTTVTAMISRELT